MLPLSDLRRAVKNALSFASSQTDVEEVEVFASAGANLTVRLNYTSHIPSNGVEEPKSTEGYGLGIRATFRTPEGIKTGFGSEPTDLSLEGAARALDKARFGAVSDAEFVSLPKRETPLRANSKDDKPDNYDPALMRIGGKGLVDAGWRMMDRALDSFQSSEDLMGLAGSADKMAELGLILGGDVVMIQDRMAIASTHIPRVQTEQNTLIMSFATAMIESQASKGSGWSVGSRLADFSGEAAAEAARNAVESMGGQRIPTGSYRVILGPQAVAEILEWVLMPGLSLDMFIAGASPFMGKLGQTVASEDFNLYDDSGAPGLPSSKSITDEGLPTGRTELIRDGKLSGMLADYYNYQRILNDPQGREKLGAAPKDSLCSIAPRNGFRPGNGGGRDFASPPGAVANNLVIEGGRGYSHEELLGLVGNGVYIGRIWYTYPVNGITSGDFSGTIIGDSYLIKDGRLAAPLKPNTVRMNDNVLRLINNTLGIATQRRGTVRWSSDQVTWAPEIAVDAFGLEEISEYMESV
ncbi:MAG: TldD/PmbA family protein [Chloroflexi bacterium]|nr:TldD/PmbA family protein [Chloroflexota bacterium]